MSLVFRLLLLFCGILYGNSVEFIESKPQGIARDFYIYEYLQGDISQDDAMRLYPLIEYKSPKNHQSFIRKDSKRKTTKRAILQESNI